MKNDFAHATLKELQNFVTTTRRERGFTHDPERVMLLLMEEVGEAARELKRSWSPNYTTFSKERFAEELADIQFVLLGLAGVCEIDLSAALQKKTSADGEREWKSIDNPIPLKEND